MSEPSSGILGRISGKLLAPNLVRNGYDLTFRNGDLDPDILYLDVNNMRVGINTVPSFDLHVDSTIKSTNWQSTNQIVVGNNNIIIDDSGTISSLTGSIIISPNQVNPSITIQRNITDEIEIDDNFITTRNSNSNLEIDPINNLEILNSTNISGNLNVTGTINVSGNLLKDGNLIIGDDIVDLEQFVPENDTVDFNAPLSQDLKPGVSNTHNLGRDSLDSTPGRWGSVYFTDNFTNTTNLFADTAIISDQIFINGITRQIDTLQSNDELIVNSDTGQVYVEDIKFIKNAGWIVKFILSNPNAFNTPASDLFGLSLDTSDSYIIAGVYNEDDAGGLSSGKAYIFSALTGTLLYTLDNPNPFGTSANDLFGYSVSISESYAIVGAYQEDVTGINSSGKAYIYSTTTGALLYTLDNPILDDDAFGFSVSITESFAIIGAPYAFGPAVASGKAYIYSTTTGALLHTLDNPNAFGTGVLDFFGDQVAICESYAIVATYSEDDAGGTLAGKAYIYSTTTGALLHTLNNPNAFGTSAVDLFGWKVDISESYAIVSAYQEDATGVNSSGVAYIFSTTTGALLHTLLNPNPVGTASFDQFGFDCSITEDYAVVSAYTEDETGSPSNDSGKVYIYSSSTGTLLQTLDNPNAFGTPQNDNFGVRVRMSGPNIIVGAAQEDDAGGLASGKIYMYRLYDAFVNLNNTPITFTGTGTGYFTFSGTNGLVIPSGTTAERVGNEIGETRWNTTENYLECFDGSTWNLSTGVGEVDPEEMAELGNIYTLILG